MPVLRSATRARLTTSQSTPALLDDLPEDLQLRICEAVPNLHDRAALCLASPRLGLTAMRTLSGYKERFMPVAIALCTCPADEVLDEACLRRYAAAKHATEEGCRWLAAAAERNAWPLSIAVRKAEGRSTYWSVHNGTHETAVLRRIYPDGSVELFEGERGDERVVRGLHKYGTAFFEGERNAERMVRIMDLDGVERFYEGEKHAERMVRLVRPEGHEEFYEGEQLAERRVRTVYPDGRQRFYEGERGAERRVRTVNPDGREAFFEGEAGSERLVRIVHPDGATEHF